MFLITWCIAAIADAFMDTVCFRLHKSIFKHKNPDVWNPMRSGTLMKPWLGWMRMDPWHIAKLVKFAAIITTTLLYLYKPLFGTDHLSNIVIYGVILDGCTLVLLWFIVFESTWKLMYKP